MSTLGIIDIGSNSIKLLIVKINKDKSYEGVFNKKFQIRLTDYISNDKDELSPIGIRNFYGIISTFKILCNQFQCSEIIAVGTEALRKIKNSEDLIKDISSSLHVNIKILSPKEECYYGYISSLPTDEKDYVHLDIGGGSVEVGLVKSNKLIKCDSIPIGALFLTNKFMLNKKNYSNYSNVSKYITSMLEDINWINECKHIPLIVIGGSIKTIGRISQLESNTIKNIHGLELFNDDVKKLLNKVVKMNVSDISKSMELPKTRSDILIGALLLVNSIFTYLNSPKLIISQYTIRDGIIKEYIDKHLNI